jgi:hypothetical protein
VIPGVMRGLRLYLALLIILYRNFASEEPI